MRSSHGLCARAQLRGNICRDGSVVTMWKEYEVTRWSRYMMSGDTDSVGENCGTGSGVEIV